MQPGPRREPPPAPWHRIYLSVTVLSVGVLVGVEHGFPRIPHRLELVVLGVIVAMFAVTSLLHWYDVNGPRYANWFPKRRW